MDKLFYFVIIFFYHLLWMWKKSEHTTNCIAVSVEACTFCKASDRNIQVFSKHWKIRPLTHWSWVTHICVSNLTIIGSDNSLSPDRRQAIIWTNAELLLIGPSGTNFCEILIRIDTFSFKKMHLKMLSAKWRPFCLSLNVLIKLHYSHGSLNFWRTKCGHAIFM